MQFKTDRIKQEWESGKLDKLLTSIVNQVDELEKEIEITLTCIFRTAAEEVAIYGSDQHSVHQVWRGVDLRKTERSQAIIDWVNSKWVYDPARPNMECGIIHEVTDPNGQPLGWHIHLQTHPDTVEQVSQLGK